MKAFDGPVKLKLRGEWYLVEGEGAQVVREVLQEKGVGEIRVPLERAGEVIAELIMHRGCRVEEYSEINGREVKTREGSPGHWIDFAEYLVRDVDTAKTAGVVISSDGGVCQVTVAVVGTVEQTIGLFGFSDTEIFSTLMHVLYEQNVKEAVYRDSSLEKVFVALGITHHQLTGAVKAAEPDRAAVAMVEQVLNIRTHEYQLKTETLSHVLRLDATVAKAVLEGEISLWGEINCRTPQGKRLLRTYFKLPSADPDEIARRHQIIEELQPVADEVLRGLQRTPDILVICKRLVTPRASLPDILKILGAISSAQVLLKQLSGIGALAGECQLLEQCRAQCRALVEQVHLAVDPNTREIRPEYHEGLAEWHRQKAAAEREVVLEYNREVQQSGLQGKKSKLEYNAQHGYHIKLPRAESASILGKRLIQLSAQKSGAVFTTAAIKQLSGSALRIIGEIEREEAQVVRELKELAGGQRQWLEVLNHTVAVVDVFASLAVFARVHNLVRPTFSSGRYLIEDAYHPLLPALRRRQEALGMKVPEITRNTFELGEDRRFCVITGPNMGGKTTFLKTVALISVLAQMGSFVPASRACIPLFKSLFIRIGASDAPDKNISTFMAEMLDISKILNEADKDSLVIIDELGRGTSDADGYAIAQATTEHILSLGALTLFATHFYDICQIPGVVNQQVRCLETDGAPIMTYQIAPGQASQSHGINVAKHAGFPQEVINQAENTLQQQPSQPRG